MLSMDPRRPEEDPRQADTQIRVADGSMSLDNVAVAAAAPHITSRR